MRRLETVDRALQVLQAFDSHGQELTVSELAGRLDIHRSSASRLAGTLADRCFLERVPGSEAFRLGPEVARLGMLAVGWRDIVAEARRPMDDLAERVGEAVVLSVLDGDQTLDIAQIDGPHRIGARQWSGQRSPLHASSDGKIFLAFCDVDPDRLVLDRRTPHTITSVRKLRAEIERVRAQGWSVARGEFEEGLQGAAAPVWDHLDRCVAALSVSGPEYRLSEKQLPEIAHEVRSAAEEISARMGHMGSRDD